MKKVVLAGLLTAGLAVSTSAYEFRTTAAFNGGTGSQVKTYHNLGLGQSEFLLGFDASQISFDGDKKKAVLFEGNVGLSLKTDIPVLNDFEFRTTFGQYKTDGGEGNFQIGRTWTISKNTYYKLTDKIDLGVTADLLKVSFDDKNVSILPSISPAISLAVKL